MNKLVSVIIPCFNGESTIAQCLSAIYQSEECHYEVIVVDDHSIDNSLNIIQQFPCKLIELERRRGAAYARNIGAKVAKGDVLFFTDADCVVMKKTLKVVQQSLTNIHEKIITGGTYTRKSYDNNFFSNFQSIFIHYSETKHPVNPDYIATHALAMHSKLFKQYAGFNNHVFPILEDVEYSHRLKKLGVRLQLNPYIQVQHIFNFTLLRSMKNALRKTKYWTAYTIDNKDLFKDSGTASYELKTNTFIFAISILMLIIFLLSDQSVTISVILVAVLCNTFVNYCFISTMHKSFGLKFTIFATTYYFCVYPMAVVIGSLLGINKYLHMHFLAKDYG